jgi:hypothetical protein
MATSRHTDPGPAARQCRRCGTTHRTHTAAGVRILCPPADRWLVSGKPLQPDQKDQR